MAPPGFDENMGLLETMADLPVQELVAQPCIEALDVPVLPRRAGFDEDGRRADRGDTVPDGPGDAFEPLSERMLAGMPRRMNRSARTSMTSVEESIRRARTARL